MSNPFAQLSDALELPRLEPIPLIGLQAVMPNPRLWELHGKEVDGTATAEERAEMDALCRRMEAEADDLERRNRNGGQL